MHKLLLLLFYLPCFVFAQPPSKIAGTWQGKLETSQKKLKYEMVIADSSGNLSGYSKIYFYLNGEEYVAIKSLKISRDQNRYVFEEDKLLFDNLQDELPKKARQINTLVLVEVAEKLELTGFFKARVEKGQRNPTGDMTLQKLKEPDSSALLKDLSQLQITNKDQLFPTQLKEEPPTAEIENEEILTTSFVATTAINFNARKNYEPVVKKPSKQKVYVKPVPSRKQPDEMAVVPKTIPKPAPKPTVQQAVPKTTAAAPVVVAPVVTAKPTVPQKETVEANLGNRSIETIQTVYFKTDSVKLTLYDNGEVDGDVVSVILNGRIIMEKKTLSTNPIAEMVYFTPEMGDSLQMIMFAENLGSIAPNTGLLIVQDGRDRYEIRFSGDLNKNAAIIFKRRKKE